MASQNKDDLNSNLKSVTNQLLLEYDNKFNDNYNDIVQLNSSIQNKEELILKTNEVILYKERNIIILQYLLYFTIAFFLVTLLYISRDLRFRDYVLILVLSFLILGVACYMHIARQFSYVTISRKLETLKVAMTKYANKLLKEKVPNYECPNECATKDNNDDDDSGDGSFKYKNKEGLLKIDPSANVWKYGDVPSGSDLNFEDTISEEDSPQPMFGTNYPKSTYYECKWLGNSSTKNMPPTMRSQSKKYSSIPCHYRPNNTEVQRWFCEKDPNDLGKDENIEDICQKVN